MSAAMTGRCCGGEHGLHSDCYDEEVRRETMLTGGAGGQPSELFCALDIGTSKVCALIAQVDDNGQLKVVGAGRVPSQGLRKGVVVNTSEATACIGKAIDEAERTSTLTMESAYVSISGAHISAIGSKGVVDLGKNGRRVVPEDCQKALDQAGGIALPHNREIVNVVARQYRLDDKEGVDNPVGSTGYRLEVEATVTTGASSNILNLTNCVLDNGVRIQDNALVSAAVLSNRYLTNRFLPDKAIDLVDEAASKLRIEIDSMPTEIDVVQRRILQLEIEQVALEKESDSASRERLDALHEELAAHNTDGSAHPDIREAIDAIPLPPTNTVAGWLVWDTGSNCYWQVTATNLRFYVWGVAE